jgi:hypothetical protein
VPPAWSGTRAVGARYMPGQPVALVADDEPTLPPLMGEALGGRQRDEGTGGAANPYRYCPYRIFSMISLVFR